MVVLLDKVFEKSAVYFFRLSAEDGFCHKLQELLGLAVASLFGSNVSTKKADSRQL